MDEREEQRDSKILLNKKKEGGERMEK